MANEPLDAPAGAGMPAGGQDLEPRAVAPGRGASWWSEGWRLFIPSVGVWILVAVILVAVNIALSWIPVLGPLASQILFPVFAGGLMLGCRAVDRGNSLTVPHLFAGFQQRTGPLVLVGLIYTVLVIAAMVVVGVLLLLFFGGAVIGAFAAMGDPNAMWRAMGSISLAALVGALFFLALYLPIVMAVWFAPALVMLGGMEPLAAVQASFLGCLRNFVPFLLYGLIGLGLAIVASIPLGLGWLVLGPVTVASLYASYCDIFEDKQS